MNRYNHAEYQALLAEHPGSFNSSLRDVRHDDQGSQSESEDGVGYKIELDIEEDTNTSLTAQTLNTDGTPKRPMNAFMIFARRRRPQVSSENQSMRTGEISKILSREWNAMDISEKQFYLDQAKTLKENFNTKYPDYVYRRRPNNTRKKRRPDPGTSRAFEHPVVDHMRDDIYPDYGDTSPVDHEDHTLESVGHDIQYPGLEHNVHAHSEYDPQRGIVPSHSGSSGYCTPDPSYRQMGTREPRLSYVTPHTGSHVIPDMSVASSSASSRMLDTSTHPPTAFQSYPQPPQQPSYPPEPSNPHGAWETLTARSDQGRPPSWVSGSHNRSALATDANYFPTLTSPFYPNQGQLQTTYTRTPTTSTPPQPYMNVQMQPSPSISREPSGYDNRSLTPLPPIQSSYCQNPGDEMVGVYQPPQARTSVPLPLPPMHARSGTIYSHQHAMYPSPPAGSVDPSHGGYWSRDKMDGQ